MNWQRMKHQYIKYNCINLSVYKTWRVNHSTENQWKCTMRKCQRKLYKSVLWWLQFDGWCGCWPNGNNTYKILAAISVEWSSALSSLIKTDPSIPLGMVHLTVNKTLPTTVVNQITKTANRERGFPTRLEKKMFVSVE